MRPADEELTVDEVWARVEAIRRIAVDDEVAHSDEDRLRGDVLRAIASGAHPDPVNLAVDIARYERYRLRPVVRPIACLDDYEPEDTLEADLAASLAVLALCRWMAGR